jgi:hypothetical protein
VSVPENLYDLPSMQTFARYLKGCTGALQHRLRPVDEAIERVWRDVNALGQQLAQYEVDVAPVTAALHEAGPNAPLVQPFYGVTADAVRRLGLATGIAHSMKVDGEQLLAKVAFVQQREKELWGLNLFESGTSNQSEVARLRDLVFTQAGNHAPELSALIARFRWGGADAVRAFVHRRGIAPEQLRTLLAAVPEAARALGASDSPPPPELAAIIRRAPAGRYAGWTSELTADERAMYALLYPNLVGQTHGLPAIDRDAANRVLLLGRRHVELERIAAADGPDDGSLFAAAERLRMIDFALSPETRQRYLILDIGHGGGPGGLTLTPVGESLGGLPKDDATHAWLLELLRGAQDPNDIANKSAGTILARLEGLRGLLRQRGYSDREIDELFQAVGKDSQISPRELERRLRLVNNGTRGLEALSIIAEELHKREDNNLSVPGAIGSGAFQFLAGELAVRGVQLACAEAFLEGGAPGVACFAVSEAAKPAIRAAAEKIYMAGNVLWHYSLDDLDTYRRYVQNNQRLPVAIVGGYDPESPEAPDPIIEIDKPPAAPTPGSPVPARPR